MNNPGEAVSCLTLLALAITLQAVSGIPLLVSKCSSTAQRISAFLMLSGSIVGLAGAIQSLVSPATQSFVLEWGLPFGPAEIGVDPLSAIFLLPVFIVTGCSAVYGLGYWPAKKHPHNVARLTFFLGLLAASLSTLVVARNSILFLVAWEVMAFASYFTLTTEDEQKEVRDAGALYMVTTHIGTLALFAMFSLLKTATGGFNFPPQASLSAQMGIATGIFFAALVGFGCKAGVMPLHVWLPSAHSNAPSHISAIMSGVVLKMGIYGMIRVFSFFFDLPVWWGGDVLALGMVSGIIGVAFAIGQHDLKRMLAYHSIENIGIIMMGVGVALIGQSTGNQAMMALGMAGALLHVVNHATFKSLLFLGAGSVIHATGTREIDRLGGVWRRLPITSTLFLIGAVAICGLPPLNGFVSELLVYLGCFTAISSSSGMAAALPALAAPALALVGGLAVACFVKVYGVIFLGTPRSPEHAGGHEGPWTMLGPMSVLAGICALIGMAPGLFASPLDSALPGWQPSLATQGAALENLAPFGWISLLGAGLVSVALMVAVLLIHRLKKLPQSASDTWGCGYLRPTPRMQYTASSFAEMLVHLFRGVLLPERHLTAVTGLFPKKSGFASRVPEAVLERIYFPFFRYLYEKSIIIRKLQHGQLQIYILYTFITLVAILAWRM